MNKKGVVLIISMVIMAVLLVLTGVYFTGLMTEKRATDRQEFVLQALNLAEAGANHGLSELRERIRTDLKSKVATVHLASVFSGYVTTVNPLGLLRDYAYAAGDTQFSVAAGKATLTLASPSLDTAVAGNYTATITIEANGAPTNPSGEVYLFPYKFSIESIGSVTRTTPNTSKTTRLVQGTFSITTRRDTFAKFALFTSHHGTPSGTTVWFTANTNFTGPVHTNERFSFANNPSAHFTEDVAQHQNTARYYNNGWSTLLDSDHNAAIDVPVFEKTFERGYDIITLTSSITQTDLKNQALGGIAEPGNGISVPNDGTNVLGGIYIRGNQGNHSDDPQITMGTTVDGPVYTILRDGVTKIVTVNYTTNQTTVQTVSGSTDTYQGIPDGLGNEGILIYTNDDVGSLSGVVQQASNVTVSAERDIVIGGNLTYQQYSASPLNADGYTNVLGILSWGGDVRVGTSAPDDVQIHGVVMAPHGVFRVDDYNQDSPRGVATLLGGAITDFYGAFGTFSGSTPTHGYGRNFVYDDRMMHGTTPPYFPYLSNFVSFDDGKLDQKLVWQDKGV
ncbi:MAG: DUF4900 domain-containing protein [Candidatus Omnitrophota bacterium]|jgi:Tfp pilus assembly protein PilX